MPGAHIACMEVEFADRPVVLRASSSLKECDNVVTLLTRPAVYRSVERVCADMPQVPIR
jgi:hypothetical protein